MNAILKTGVLLWVVLFVNTGWAAEKLVCGFEQDELAVWPISIYAGKGDSNEIVYSIPYYNAFLTRPAPAHVTQGSRALCHEIFADAVPGNKTFKINAYRYQSWATISAERLLDSTRGNYGEWTGPLDWGSDHFCTLFSLFHVADQLPADLQDWSAYDYIYFDVKTTLAKVVLKASVHGKLRPSHFRIFEVEPGQYYTACLPIKDLAWVSRLDLSDIKDFRISLRDVKGVTDIYIDNIRLATKDVVPAYPVVTDNRPLEPWLLTSMYTPPVEPPPAPSIMARVTGAVASAAPVTIVDEAATPYRNYAYGQGVAPFDNVKYGIIERFKGYQYWALPPEPNSNPGGDHGGRAWIGSVDNGQTWRSDSVAGQYPLLFGATLRGTVQACAFGDNFLRGVGYYITHGWCMDYAPGNAFTTVHQFYKIMAQDNRWVVYPDNTFQQTPPQLPHSIIVSDVTRICGGGLVATVLPSGRMWAAYTSNHLNRLKGYWSLYASYSDDGGIRWQYPLRERSGVWASGQDESVACDLSNPVCLVPYTGQLMCLINDNARLSYTLGNGQQWSAFSNFGSIGWGNKSISAVNYKDSTVFLCCGNNGGSSNGNITLFIFKNGTATSQTVLTALLDSVGGARMTLCGERLWFFWNDANKKAICSKKYFINEDRFSTEQVLVYGQGLAFKLPPVSPPSHVPLVYQDTVSGKDAWKFLRVPIDAEEAALDPDYDGLENTSETAAGTASDNPDSDGDGLWDGQEVVLLGTNPKNVDTDNDGDNDALEFYSYTDPRDATKTATHNQAPVVSLVTDSTGGTLRLDATNTTDAENDYLRYFWDIELNTGAILHAEGDRIICQNVHGARVTVEDGKGNASSATWGEPPNAMSGCETANALYMLTAQPNPFSQWTALHFGLTGKGKVSLKIYDVRGKLVKVLMDGEKPSGVYRVTWEPGRTLASGIYCAIYKVGNQVMTKKMVYSR
ncbi:MAG: T9SS type A sorting domain-containing protein [Fibrobacterota bacterium]